MPHLSHLDWGLIITVQLLCMLLMGTLGLTLVYDTTPSTWFGRFIQSRPIVTLMVIIAPVMIVAEACFVVIALIGIAGIMFWDMAIDPIITAFKQRRRPQATA